MAVGFPIFGVATNAAGVPVSGATVAVYIEGTLSAISLFSDTALSVALPNPFAANADGTFFAFASEAQRLRIRVMVPGATTRDINGINLGSRALYGTLGLEGANDAGTPDTVLSVSAGMIALRDAHNNIAVRINPGTLTTNVSTPGPVANGRDQAAAFGASSWIHFYYIWNASILATIASTATPFTGPALPSGYTHWSYIGAVRFTAGSVLARTRFRGNTFLYDDQQNALLNGVAVALTAVDVSALVPPNALSMLLAVRYFSITADGAGVFNTTLALSSIAATAGFRATMAGTGGAGVAWYHSPGSVPILRENSPVSFYYAQTITTGVTPITTIDVQGYTMPN